MNPRRLDARDLFEAMVEVTRRHAERLAAQGEAATLALDECPRCNGTLMRGDTTVLCAAGCGFRYSERGSDPIASRKAPTC